MAKFNIANEKSARKMLADAVSSLGTVQRKLQALVVWGVEHAEKHGDHTFITECYNSLYAKNKRSGAQLFAYLEDLLNIDKAVVKADGESVVKLVRIEGEDGKKLAFVKDRELLAANWWEHKRAAVDTAYDVDALEKYLEAKIKSNKSTAGAIAYCEEFLTKIKADRVTSLQAAA
jgi:hypothetical protein